ncbi:hypothetical protein PM082_010790 [Marasmius tenuissimus]|nr:hypothetical protein PM082_010790 [Marasmius tenuissimus]
MASTPDPNATNASPAASETTLNLDKVATENQAIAAALKKSQLDNQVLTSQLKDAHTRDNSVEPASSISSKSSKSSATKPWHAEVKQSGQKYMALYRPWDPPSFEGDIEDAKVTNPFDVKRYSNKDFEAQCSYAEIFTVIPKTAEHIEMLAERLPDYKKRGGVSTGRSNAVAKLKQVAGELYPEFHRDHPNYFVSRGDSKVRSENVEARRLLGFSNAGYAKLPPLLFRGFIPEDPNGLFRNEAMMKFGKVLLFGPQSIKADASKTKQTIGQLWKVKSVTPGFIAFIAIFVRFLFSEDKDFVQSGQQINYVRDFEYYKKSLIVSADNAHIQKTFAMWNNYLFGTPTPKATTANAEASDNPEIDEMLKVIGNMGSDNEEDFTPTASPIPASRQPTPVPRSSASTTDAAPDLAPVENVATPQEDTPVVVDDAENEEVEVEVDSVPQVAAAAVGSRTKRGAGGGGKPSEPTVKPVARRGIARGRGVTKRGAGRPGRVVRGKTVVEEEEVVTEEEVSPRPTPTRLTRQGASSQIHIECGDEETSD